MSTLAVLMFSATRWQQTLHDSLCPLKNATSMGSTVQCSAVSAGLSCGNWELQPVSGRGASVPLGWLWWVRRTSGLEVKAPQGERREGSPGPQSPGGLKQQMAPSGHFWKSGIQRWRCSQESQIPEQRNEGEKEGRREEIRERRFDKVWRVRQSLLLRKN